MPGTLGAGAWGVLTLGGVLPLVGAGGPKTQSLNLGWGQCLTLGSLGRQSPGRVKTILVRRQGAGPSNFHLHFPGQNISDAPVWNLTPDPMDHMFVGGSPSVSSLLSG